MNRYFRFYIMDIEAREAMLDRMERLTELPLLLLSFIMIPLLLGPLLWKLSPTEDLVFSTLDNPRRGRLIVGVDRGRLQHLRVRRLRLLGWHRADAVQCGCRPTGDTNRRLE